MSINYKKLIPWQLKILIKIVFSQLGIDYSFLQKYKLVRHGKMDQAEYALKVFQEHIFSMGINLNDLKGKTILELGPGDSITTALIASSYGARTILIDSHSAVIKDIKIYKDLAVKLHVYDINIIDLSVISSFEELLSVLNSKYYVNGLDSFSKIQSNTVDYIFSQAVLEHIKKKDFSKLMDENRRVIKDSGLISHSVDLKDHLGYALNHLRFSESIWESRFMSQGSFYTNRIGFDEMIGRFNSAQFNVDLREVKRWNKLPTPRKRMALPFKNLTEENLLVSEFKVLLKPK